ncbi:MAG: PEP-CTERM sorting domain-containing protein [Acidobacteria bacterium]|nr:PEP-CTERM sorting domain-containing protein [Acidobacteriota bacterium]
MPALSYGVYISAPGSVPEPVGVSFLLLGATGLAASVRRRFRRPFVE